MTNRGPPAKPFPKGNKLGRSRKGIPNKVTVDLKAMILGALEDAGGRKYLLERASDPKTSGAFLQLAGRCLPREISGTEGGAPIIVQVVTGVPKQAT